MISLHVSSANEVTITFVDGVAVRFSYPTPVAAFVPGRGYLRTDRFYSSTTSKHINAWIIGHATTVRRLTLIVTFIVLARSAVTSWLCTSTRGRRRHPPFDRTGTP